MCDRPAASHLLNQRRANRAGWETRKEWEGENKNERNKKDDRDRQCSKCSRALTPQPVWSRLEPHSYWGCNLSVRCWWSEPPTSHLPWREKSIRKQKHTIQKQKGRMDSEKKTVGSKVSIDEKGTRLYCVSQTRLLSKSSYRGEVYKLYQGVVEGFRFFTTRKVPISQCSKSVSVAFKILLN